LSIDKNLTIEGNPGQGLIDIHQGLGAGSAVVVEAGATVILADLNINSFDRGQDAPSDADAGADGMDGVAGLNGTGAGQSGTKGGDGDPGQDATMASGNAMGPAPALENDGTLTLLQCEIDGANGVGAAGADGADGGGGGMGGIGGDGTPPGNGANGGIGGDGGAGSAGTDGGNAVGGVINTGALTLEDSVISGAAVAGDGGNGGQGGAGGYGGSGGRGANDGEGGNGGSGGGGGAGGAGGSAVGGIVNTGTVTIVGAAILFGDSAQAGAGGGGGTGGAAGAGGIGNGNGMNGDAGSDGASGVTGTETADYLDKGTTNGAFTVNGYLYDFLGSQQPLPVDVGGGANAPVDFSYSVEEFGGFTGGFPQTGSVEWKIVLGAKGPPLSDFVGPTSGTLNFSAEQAGDYLVQHIAVQLKGDAAAPRNEAFTLELLDPATGDVLGAVSSLTQNVTNELVPMGSGLAANVDASPAAFNGVGTTVLTGTTTDAASTVTGVEIFNLDGDAATPLGAATVNGNSWSFSEALAPGVYQIEAVATDAADNVAGAMASYELSVGLAGQPSLETFTVTGQSYSSYDHEFSDGIFVGSQYFTTDITGESYTETVKSLDANGDKVSLEYEGVTGEPYDAIQYFFSGAAATGYATSGWDTYYADQSSGLARIDFDGSGNLVEEFYEFGGTTDGTLESLEIDYVAGQRADSLYTYVGPGGSSFTQAVYEFDNNNNYVGATYTFTGQTYDEIQASFTPGTSPKVTEITYSQYTGTGGPNDVSYFYSTSGALTGIQETFTGITGQAYTSDSVLYSASYVPIASQYQGYTTKPFSTLTYFDNGSGATREIARDYTSVAAEGSLAGQAYDSHETIDNAANVLLATAYHLDGGGNVYIGVSSNETSPTFGGSGVTPDAAELAYALPGGDWTITGGGTNESFSFASLFNKAEITDYGASVTANAPDQIMLAASDFGGWQTFIGEGAASGTGGVDTTFTSTVTGDKLTLHGVTLARVSAMKSDFAFA
jgi:hypothetical protein